MNTVYLSIGSNVQPERNLVAAVMVQTHVTAPRLKHDILQIIERQLGRVHQKKSGCTIDLDIMLFNNEIFERAFVDISR